MAGRAPRAGRVSGVTTWRRLRNWTEADVWPRLHEVLEDPEPAGPERVDAVEGSSARLQRGGSGMNWERGAGKSVVSRAAPTECGLVCFRPIESVPGARLALFELPAWGGLA